MVEDLIRKSRENSTRRHKSQEKEINTCFSKTFRPCELEKKCFIKLNLAHKHDSLLPKALNQSLKTAQKVHLTLCHTPPPSVTYYYYLNGP